MTSSLAQPLIICVILGRPLDVFWASYIYKTMYNSNKIMCIKEFWKLTSRKNVRFEKEKEGHRLIDQDK